MLCAMLAPVSQTPFQFVTCPHVQSTMGPDEAGNLRAFSSSLISWSRCISRTERLVAEMAPGCSDPPSTLTRNSWQWGHFSSSWLLLMAAKAVLNLVARILCV